MLPSKHCFQPQFPTLVHPKNPPVLSIKVSPIDETQKASLKAQFTFEIFKSTTDQKTDLTSNPTPPTLVCLSLFLSLEKKEIRNVKYTVRWYMYFNTKRLCTFDLLAVLEAANLFDTFFFSLPYQLPCLARSRGRFSR